MVLVDAVKGELESGEQVLDHRPECVEEDPSAQAGQMGPPAVRLEGDGVEIGVHFVRLFLEGRKVLQNVAQLVPLPRQIVPRDLDQRAHGSDALLEQLVHALLNLGVLLGPRDESQAAGEGRRSDEGSRGLLEDFRQGELAKDSIAERDVEELEQGSREDARRGSRPSDVVEELEGRMKVGVILDLAHGLQAIHELSEVGDGLGSRADLSVTWESGREEPLVHLRLKPHDFNLIGSWKGKPQISST